MSTEEKRMAATSSKEQTGQTEPTSDTDETESVFDDADTAGFSGVADMPSVDRPVRRGTVADAFASGHMTHLTADECLKSGWYDGTDIAGTLRGVFAASALIVAVLVGIMGWNAAHGNAGVITPPMVVGAMLAMAAAAGAVMAGTRMRANSRKKASEEIDVDATGEWLMYAYREDGAPTGNGRVLVAHLSECSWCPMPSDKTVILVGPMGAASVKEPSDAYDLDVREMTAERGGVALYDYFTKGLAETLDGTKARRDNENPPAEYARMMATRRERVH